MYFVKWHFISAMFKDDGTFDNRSLQQSFILLKWWESFLLLHTHSQMLCRCVYSKAHSLLGKDVKKKPALFRYKFANLLVEFERQETMIYIHQLSLTSNGLLFISSSTLREANCFCCIGNSIKKYPGGLCFAQLYEMCTKQRMLSKLNAITEVMNWYRLPLPL